MINLNLLYHSFSFLSVDLNCYLTVAFKSFAVVLGGSYIPRPGMRKTCMVREHYMIVFSVNYVSVFCMGLCVSDKSHTKCIYMIDQEHNYMVLPDHTSISP